MFPDLPGAVVQDRPDFVLSKSTVRRTNLFCVESKGVPRVQMPRAAGDTGDGLPG